MKAQDRQLSLVDLAGEPQIAHATLTAVPPSSTRRARMSACGRYRYSLTRRWGLADSLCVFVCLNPSTADADKDDHTVRRCVAYARAWSYGALEIVNLFALRSTDPERLLGVPNPVGPENDEAILDAARCARLIVCAWSDHPAARDRAIEVEALLRGATKELHCLRVTQRGAPSHPARLPGELRPLRLPPRFGEPCPTCRAIRPAIDGYAGPRCACGAVTWGKS